MNGVLPILWFAMPFASWRNTLAMFSCYLFAVFSLDPPILPSFSMTKKKILGNIRFVVRYFHLLNAICYVAESLKDQVNLPFEIFVKNHQKCIFLFNFVQANKLHLSLLNSPLLQSEDHGAGVTFICKISIR